MTTQRILVIDDEAFIRDHVQNTLTKAGYQVETAPNIRTAVDKVAQNDYNLILCDVMIPALGGFELIDQIKSDPAKKHIPIIMVTGVDREILQSTRHEADAVITKPFTTSQLLAKVREFLATSPTEAK